MPPGCRKRSARATSKEQGFSNFFFLAQGRQVDAQSVLTTIAEVSIALAGFTGVVAVLGNRRKHNWSLEERLQLRTLVETSLTALFASFVPSILYLVLTSEPAIWRSANLFLGVLHLSNLVAFLRRTRDARPTASQKGLLVIGIAMILAHFLTAAGLIPWFVLIFVVGLLQQVFIAALNFVLLLFPVEDSG